MLGDKAAVLETLRLKITALETNPLLKETDVPAISAGLLATPRGSLHEVFADSVRDSGAALGFALAQARSQIDASRPAVLFMQLQADALEVGLPYALGLQSFGFDPERLVFVRPQTITELLWAVEEAIACRAVAAVVADIVQPHKALDFTASRRLSLRAAASGASVFLVRYARDREATAARYRWKIVPHLSSDPPFDDRAPGPPRWRVTLEKGSLGKRRNATPAGDEYLVDWTDNGFSPADDRRRDDAGVPRRPAHPHAAPAALGDGLPQTG
jgi:protein ImuA